MTLAELHARCMERFPGHTFVVTTTTSHYEHGTASDKVAWILQVFALKSSEHIVHAFFGGSPDVLWEQAKETRQTVGQASEALSAVP